MEAILKTALKILADPQVQAGIISALIAGLVSFLVAWRTTRGDRKSREAARAQKLLVEVYNPIEMAFLKGKSLYSCVTQNKGVLAKNRRNFSSKIRPLIDEALSQHHCEGMGGFMTDFTLLEKESIAKLEDIETRLRPLLKDEINRLQKLVDKG